MAGAPLRRAAADRDKVGVIERFGGSTLAPGSPAGLRCGRVDTHAAVQLLRATTTCLSDALALRVSSVGPLAAACVCWVRRSSQGMVFASTKPSASLAGLHCGIQAYVRRLRADGVNPVTPAPATGLHCGMVSVLVTRSQGDLNSGLLGWTPLRRCRRVVAARLGDLILASPAGLHCGVFVAASVPAIWFLTPVLPAGLHCGNFPFLGCMPW
jgi:hypothetical protein